MKTSYEKSMSPSQQRMSKLKFLLISLIMIVGICFVAIWLFNAITDSKPYCSEWDQPRSRPEVKKACQIRLNEAEQKASIAITLRSDEFSEFIRSRKSGVEPFSKDITSYYGKWRAIKPYILPVPLSSDYPFVTGLRLPLSGEDNSHREYIVEKFDQHIFSAHELAEAMQLSIEACIKDIESIENELAVALRQEILGKSLTPNELPIATEEFKKAIEQLVTASQWDATKTAGNLVVSEVASTVAAQVLIRLGVSAGIFSVGAANSGWTFGASIVIGILVDCVWEWYDDPAGDIEREMTKALDDLSIKGSSTIKNELTKVLKNRSSLWSKTIEEILP